MSRGSHLDVPKSPDGERILFWSWRTGNPEIFAVNADGSGLVQMTDNLAWDEFPCWSSEWIEITSGFDQNSGFWISM